MNQEKAAVLEEKVAKDYKNITGIVVRKDNRIQYEKYFNGCTAKSPVHVYSVTKSILSILIGIAVDKGYIKSIKEEVVGFFPDYQVKTGEKTIQDITVQNLLTMTAPYKYKLLPPYIKYFTSEDGVKFTLDQLGGRGRVGRFQYTPLIGPDILSGILVKATGQQVFAFAADHLFGPLGIAVERNVSFQSKEEQLEFNEARDISGWAVDAMGVNRGGWGLTLTPADMSKVGQLVLDKGLWEGKQIVSAAWIEQSTMEQSYWKKQKLAYGYLWWIVGEDKGGYAAMGDGGNIIYVNPKNRTVVSIAALFKPGVTDRIEFIKEYVEPVWAEGNIG